MRLAIVHYHLRKGGVTKVIASALEALGEDFGDVVVLSSTPSEEPLPCPVGIVPELAYYAHGSAAEAKELHKAMVREAERHLGGSPDLWHIHNHSLGKNVNFPEVLHLLLNEGARALLQIHDFAEDGRPDNYANQHHPYEAASLSSLDIPLYPDAPQIGYAVLNGRDREILKSAGIPESRIFWLPNAVTPPAGELTGSAATAGSTNEPFLLYPTRAIRRKNLGELLLLAANLKRGRLATTLTPKNPAWVPIHDAWVALARELDLPVEFGIGEDPANTFAGLIQSSSGLVTTSVGEGFGLAFLEPWLMGKAVLGRDLPEITSDFVDNGVTLPGLYEQWPVPARLLNVTNLRKRYRESLKAMYNAYGKSLTKNEIDASFSCHASDDVFDFGFLDEIAQAEVLRNLVSTNERLEIPMSISVPEAEVITANQEVIRNSYGLESYGQQLREIYEKIQESSPGSIVSVDASAILDKFLDPARFTFLRS